MKDHFDIDAVALLVFSRTGRMLVLKELKSKPEYGKWAGMLTFPIETIHDRELKMEALDRLAREEIGIDLTSLRLVTFFEERIFEFLSGRRGRIFIYVAQSFEEFIAIPGDYDDVEFFGWKHPEELLLLEGDGILRKEVAPVLEQFV